MVRLPGRNVYLELADVAEFPYKTTLLGSAANVGDLGMRGFGVPWAVAAIGFLTAAGALLTDWDHWSLLEGTVADFSLALTILD